MKNVTKLIIALFLLGLPVAIKAQEKKEEKKEEKHQQKTKPEGFNALEHSLQKRHIKKGVPFENRRILDNLYFGGQFGLHKIGPNGKADFDAGMGFGLHVGKLFSGTNSARLSLNYIKNGQFIGKSLNRFGLSADHLYNVTSYIMGYDPNRTLELSTVAGLGMQWVKLGDESKTALDAHVGLQFKVHVTPTIDVFLEPQVGLATRSLNFAGDRDRAYNVTYGINAGVRYMLHDGGFIATKDKMKLGTSGFWSIGTGVQKHLSSLEGSGMGPSLAISLGRWLKPGVGFRLSGTFSTNTWHQANYEADTEQGIDAYKAYETTSYIGARGEVMFDPIMFFKQYDEEEKFKVKLFLGGEVGKLTKENYYMPIRRSYAGLTGGVQLGYRIQDDLLLYIEPHYTSANYSIPYTNVDASRKFTDNLVSVNIGLEFGQPIINRKDTDNAFNKFFSPYIIAGIDAGLNYPIHSVKIQEKSYLDYQAGGFIGYIFTPIHGVSLHADINRVSMDMDNGYRQFNLTSAALEYRFNILNALQGYVPDRRVEVNALLGPVVTLRKNAKQNSMAVEDDPFGDFTGTDYSTLEDNKITFGGQFAMDVSYNLNEKVGIYLKPQIRMYPSDIFDSEHCPGWRKIISCQIGASYKF